MGVKLSTLELFLVFHTSSKICINGISVIYTEFITSLSIFKGSVNIN